MYTSMWDVTKLLESIKSVFSDYIAFVKRETNIEILYLCKPERMFNNFGDNAISRRFY